MRSQQAFNYSKSTMETREQYVKSVQSRSVVFTVNFEQISYIALVFPLLTLNKYMPPGKKICSVTLNDKSGCYE